MFWRLGVLNVRRNLGRSVLSVVSMAVAAGVLTSALFLASGYPGRAFLPLRVFAGGDIMIFPKALSLGSISNEFPQSGRQAEEPVTLGYTFGRLERDWISDLWGYHPEAFDYGVLHKGEAPWFPVEEITARLESLPFVLDVYPYYTIPAFERFHDATADLERSGLAAIRGRDIEKDRDLFYFQDYIVFGRPLSYVDEGRMRCLIDMSRGMTVGYGAPGCVRSTDEVLVPKVTFVPGADTALLNYSKATTYTFQTVGGYSFEGYATPQRVVSLDVFLRIWDEVTGGAPLAVPQVSVSVPSLFAVENYVQQLREALPDCMVVSVPAAATEGAGRGGFPAAWSRWRLHPGTSGVTAGEVVLPFGVKLLMMVLTCMLGGLVVAANSLVMLTERRREIGILRAVGAKRRDIMVMVLAEVCVLTVIGSAIGYSVIRLGVIYNQLSGSASLAMVGISAVLDGLKVVGATLACAVLFGIAPALRSTSVSTVDVLREE